MNLVHTLLSALSGIDIALWDILGKMLSVPIYQLLGGQVRDRLRMYGWLSTEETGSYIDDFKTRLNFGLTDLWGYVRLGRGRAQTKCLAASSIAAGFTAYKTCPVPAAQLVETPAFMDRVVANFTTLREAAGRQVDIAVGLSPNTCIGADSCPIQFFFF